SSSSVGSSTLILTLVGPKTALSAPNNRPIISVLPGSLVLLDVFWAPGKWCSGGAYHVRGARAQRVGATQRYSRVGRWTRDAEKGAGVSSSVAALTMVSGASRRFAARSGLAPSPCARGDGRLGAPPNSLIVLPLRWTLSLRLLSRLPRSLA